MASAFKQIKTTSEAINYHLFNEFRNFSSKPLRYVIRAGAAQNDEKTANLIYFSALSSAVSEYYIKSIRFNRIEINLTNNKVNEKQFRLCGVGKPIDQELHVSHVRVRWLTHTKLEFENIKFGRSIWKKYDFLCTLFCDIFMCFWLLFGYCYCCCCHCSSIHTAGARMCTGFSRTFIVTSFFEEHLGCLSPFGRHNCVCEVAIVKCSIDNNSSGWLDWCAGLPRTI